jgi:hypothetical protein
METGGRLRTPLWAKVQPPARPPTHREKIEQAAERLWRNRFTGIVLLWAPYFISMWFWLKPQLPGVAAVVLGGIAAVMTFRDMHHTHKVLFTGAILMLIVLESRDIKKDRISSDAKALSDLRDQDKHFQSIRDAQDEDFKKTAEGLRVALAGIDSTLKSVAATEEQTKPRAVLHYTGAIDIQNAPQPPAMFRAGTEYEIKSDVVNDGNDGAKVLRALRKVFVDKPDDRATQLLLVSRFEKEWSQEVTDKNKVSYGVQYHGFQTTFRSFTDEEVNKLASGETVYLLRRIEYSDAAGVWTAEDCQHLQVVNKVLYIRVSHSCVVFRGDRLPSRRFSR